MADLGSALQQDCTVLSYPPLVSIQTAGNAVGARQRPQPKGSTKHAPGRVATGRRPPAYPQAARAKPAVKRRLNVNKKG